MESWSRLTAARRERVWGGGQWWKEEVTSQRTCMNDRWTWTTVWGLAVGTGHGLGRGGQRGKNWYNRNRITIKNFK